MYGLARDIDVTFLNERQLQQVSIGRFQVIFSFDEEVSISVEGHFRYVSDSETRDWRPGANHAVCGALALLGVQVVKTTASTLGSIELLFSNGDRLLITDANKDTESYQICGKGHTIVV